MILEIEIKQLTGIGAKESIDQFYKRNGSNGVAREGDIFFVAFSGNQIVGCVRYCIEEGTSMLRTMHVDKSCRGVGIGRRLLEVFETYLITNSIKNVYCLPYKHLVEFYGKIGFQVIENKDVPIFLVARLNSYTERGLNTLVMKRK